MDSRCKPQLHLLRGRSLANLPARFLTRCPLDLPCAPVPREPLLEREGTPGCPRLDLLGPQPQQQQIRHDRHGDRTLYPGRILGDLRLAQAHDALQFFDAEFDRPSSEIERHGQVSSGLRQIGHEQFGVLGALVTPPSTQDHRDISDLPQLSSFGKRPEDPTTSAGHDQGHADLAIIMDRQMSNQIAQVLAVGQLPGAREGHDKVPVAGLNRLQISPRGIGRIGHDYDLLAPRRAGQPPEASPERARSPIDSPGCPWV